MVRSLVSISLALAAVVGGWLAVSTSSAQQATEGAASAAPEATQQGPEQASTEASAEAKQHEPIKVLLIVGGAFHDYNTQKDMLARGIAARANVDITISYDSNESPAGRNPLFEEADWGAGYDVILHDECTASVADLEWIDKVLLPHKYGVPAVVLHCAMHSYRSEGWNTVTYPNATPWFELTGLATSGHGPQRPIDVIYEQDDNPIAAGLPNWTTDNEELYNNFTGALQPTATAVAIGRQANGAPSGGSRRGAAPGRGEGRGRGRGPGRGRGGFRGRGPATPAADDANVAFQEQDAPAQGRRGAAPAANYTQSVVAWTNLYQGKTRVFGTTLGHNSFTVANEEYLDLVTRGLIWAAGRDVAAEYHDSDPAIDEEIRQLGQVIAEDGSIQYADWSCCGEPAVAVHPADQPSNEIGQTPEATPVSAQEIPQF